MGTVPSIPLRPPAPPDPFRRAYWAGLLFSVLAPILFQFVVGAVSAILPHPLLAALTEHYARQPDWLAITAPVVVCAILWVFIHWHRKALVLPQRFFLLALLPILAAVMISPLYALFFNTAVRELLDKYGFVLVIALGIPSAWPEAAGLIGQLLAHAFAWLFDVRGNAPGLWGLLLYLPLVFATPRFAAMIERRTRRRHVENAALTPPRSAVSPRA